MRKLCIVLLLVMVVGACSTPQGGDMAAAHAKDMGFEVTGTGDRQAVVKIGESCSGTYRAWDMGNGDRIEEVYNKDGILIWSRSNTKATGPDQFKSITETAGCYIPSTTPS